MSYRNTVDLLSAITGPDRGAWFAIADLAELVDESIRDVRADLGTAHDYGIVTLTSTHVRYDGPNYMGPADHQEPHV